MKNKNVQGSLGQRSQEGNLLVEIFFQTHKILACGVLIFFLKTCSVSSNKLLLNPSKTEFLLLDNNSVNLIDILQSFKSVQFGGLLLIALLCMTFRRSWHWS